MDSFVPELVDGDNLDYSAFVELQGLAFAEKFEQTKTSSAHISEPFFRWKFHPPVGVAKIAIIRDDKGIVASNAMYPMELRMGSESLIGWQSCDTATLSRARRKGCFAKCLDILVAELDQNDVFFGFPNENSTKGFIKIASTQNQVVTTWANPLPRVRKRFSDRVTLVTRFGDEQNVLADRLVQCGKTSVYRSASYLNWRYTDHPFYDYTSFEFCERGERLGFLILRVASVLGRDLVTIMELWSVRPDVERTLLLHANAWACERGVSRIVMLDTAMPLHIALPAGFVPIPSALLPKKQILAMGGTQGERAEKSNGKSVACPNGRLGCLLIRRPCVEIAVTPPRSNLTTRLATFETQIQDP